MPINYDWGHFTWGPPHWGPNYQEFTSGLSPTPVFLVVMTLDFCANTFGTSPCVATGTPCYNTFPTCKNKANYVKSTKDYEQVSADIAAVPFRTGERPYLTSIEWLPTEIKDSLTVTGRTVLTFLDELDSDVGIDPYYTQRAIIQGTYWKKFVARNPNYKGRSIAVYKGRLGDARSGFLQVFIGTIDTISLNADGTVTVEAKDLLGSLADIQIPPKVDIKLVAGIDNAVTSITLSQANEIALPALDAAGYVRIDDEIIQYASIAGNVIQTCTRGAFDTIPDAHSADAKVQKVRYFAPANPYTHLKSMLLTDAAIAAALVDATAFDALAILDNMYVQCSAIISEPTDLSKPYFELVELVGAKSWVAEDLKITIGKSLPNMPSRTYVHFSDAENIIDGSDSVDLNANTSARATTIQLYWDRLAVGREDEIASYNRSHDESASDEEGVNMYNESIKKVIFCRWLRADYMDNDLIYRYIRNLLRRMLRMLKDPQPILHFAVMAEGCTTKTGDMVRISTDRLLNKTGAPLSREVFQIVKRSDRDTRIEFDAQKFPRKKVFFIAPTGLPDYTSATEAQKESAFLCNSDDLMSDETEGYFLY